MSKFVWERKTGKSSIEHELIKFSEDRRPKRLRVGLEVIIPKHAKADAPRHNLAVCANFNHWLLGSVRADLGVKNGRVVFASKHRLIALMPFISRLFFLPEVISKRLVSHVVMARLRKVLKAAPNKEVETTLGIKRNAISKDSEDFPRGEIVANRDDANKWQLTIMPNHRAFRYLDANLPFVLRVPFDVETENKFIDQINRNLPPRDRFKKVSRAKPKTDELMLSGSFNHLYKRHKFDIEIPTTIPATSAATVNFTINYKKPNLWLGFVLKRKLRKIFERVNEKNESENPYLITAKKLLNEHVL